MTPMDDHAKHGAGDSDPAGNVLTNPDALATLFTRDTGGYHFARWGRPIAPVIFGVADESLPPLKAAIETVVAHSGHSLVETDPEMGANLMIFFLQDWRELSDVADLDHLVPDLAETITRLQNADAGQYRVFRFEDNGAIRAAIAFIRVADGVNDAPAEEIGMEQAVKILLDWSPKAFANRAPLFSGPDGVARLRPDIAAVLQSAYDPVLPAAAQDESHVLRLFARITLALSPGA